MLPNAFYSSSVLQCNYDVIFTKALFEYMKITPLGFLLSDSKTIIWHFILVRIHKDFKIQEKNHFFVHSYKLLAREDHRLYSRIYCNEELLSY